MVHKIIHLKDHYPILGENQKDPCVALYLPDLKAWLKHTL